MATKVPRVFVTLTPETYKIVQDLSESVGASMSGLLAELAEEAAPSMAQIVQAVKLAKSKPAEAFENIADALARAQGDASQLQIELIDKKRKLRRGGKKK